METSARHNEQELELLGKLRNEQTKRIAFNTLVNTYGKQIYWHIRKIVLIHEDADDILQNTMIKAWQGIDKFRGDSKISTWLYRIATNESLTHINNTKHLQNLSTQDADKVLTNLASNDSHFNANQIQLKLQKAILTLPPKQRVVFNMRYFDEMPYEQMAQVLNTSVGALKASYHIAVQKIEKCL